MRKMGGDMKMKKKGYNENKNKNVDNSYIFCDGTFRFWYGLYRQKNEDIKYIIMDGG